MTAQTQRLDIVEIAFASALGDRNNVVRVPQTPANACPQPPVRHQHQPVLSARIAQPPLFANRVNPADGAYALVAQKHLLPQIPWLGAQLPLMHAVLGAESETPRRDLQRTPAAQPA